MPVKILSIQIFLSHRYGSCLPCSSIPYHIFQYLEKYTDDKDFLNEMYRLDENYLEKNYFLRSIDDEEQWPNLESRLKNLLQTSAQICYDQKLITKDERDEYFISG